MKTSFSKRLLTFVALAAVLIPIGFLIPITPIPLYCLCGVICVFAVWELIRITLYDPIKRIEDAYLDLFLNLFIIGFCGLGCFFLGDCTVPEYFLLLIVAFGCDTFAYLFGSRLKGKFFKSKPLKRSPSKSWEGTIGGLVSSVVLGFLAVMILRPFDLLSKPWSNTITDVIILVVLALAAIAADMAGSTYKRIHHVKDSGTKFTKALLKEHGGVIDRFFSLLTVTTIYFLIKLLVS